MANASAFGFNAQATGSGSTTVGAEAWLPTMTDASAFGYFALATGMRSTSVGAGSLASMENASAFWLFCCGHGFAVNICGVLTLVATMDNASAFGNRARATAQGATAIGAGNITAEAARASGDGSVALGGATYNTVTGAPTGTGANASGSRAVAYR